MSDRRRILIVDDDDLVARSLSLRLAAMGYGIAGVTASGAGAMAMVESERPDLVLMDIMLAGDVDGIEAARLILERSAVPILYLTAHADDALFERARITAPHAYLLKPYNDRELQLAIELALQRHRHDALRRDEAERQDRRISELGALLSALVEGSTDCIFVKDTEGRYVFCNAALAQTLGRGRDEIIGCRDADLLSPEAAARLRAEDSEVLAGEAARSFEEVIDLGRGPRTWLTTKGCLRIGDELHGVFGIARDISERKDGELRLRRISGFYNALAQIGQAIAHAASPQELLEGTCEIVVSQGRVGGAWIGFLGDGGWIRAAAGCGLAQDYLAGLRVSVDAGRPEGQCQTAVAVREGEPTVFNDFLAEPRARPWHEAARVAGVGASAAVPIRRGGQVVGALTVYAGEPGFFDRALIDLLAELAADVAFALDAFDADAQRRRAEAELHDALARLQVLSARLIDVQESERRSLARDLHDDIGQSLTMIKIVLLGLAASNKCGGCDEIREAGEIADRTLQRVRALSVALRPPQLDDLGLVSALRAHLGQVGRHAGIKAVFVADAALPRVPENIAIACFRIAQEALTNVVRHAGASVVTLELRHADGALTLRLHDDGAGFDTAAAFSGTVAGTSLGLLSMQERAALAGGWLEVTSREGGSEVRATFPLPGGGQ